VIVGVGIDVVDVARFIATVERVPALRERLFTPEERDLPDASLAARFAAKEAIAKAIGAPGGMSWQDATVRRVLGQQPVVEVRGTGVAHFHLSISHDAGIASAMVVAERP
jgi:holo-[acyl-carrier protein] synthase